MIFFKICLATLLALQLTCGSSGKNLQRQIPQIPRISWEVGKVNSPVVSNHSPKYYPLVN